MNSTSTTLVGKKGLIIGVANAHSIAWGCAQAMHNAGAELALTWLNERTHTEIQPLAEQLGAALCMPLDVEQAGQLEAVFEAITQQWGKLDFVVHSIAFAPQKDLHGRVVDSSAQGFARAMDISCHSFIRVAKLAEPLMKNGGSLQTMSYLGADSVIANYGLMGPVKAALESTVRYLAAELGLSGIRVNAISPGALETRAASGIAHFDQLLDDAKQRSPMRQLTTIHEVGALSAFLASDAACSMTGGTLFVDGGMNILN